MTDLFAPTHRQPSAQARDPRVHYCATCDRPDAPCGMMGQWFCYGECTPDGWAPKRGEGDHDAE